MRQVDHGETLSLFARAEIAATPAIWREPFGRTTMEALALGCAYFQYTWIMINDHSAPAETGVAYLVWLLDLQNVYLAIGSLVRWYVAEDRDERDLFRALSVHTLVYFVIVFVNDHYFAGNPAFGPEYGTIVTVAFMVLCGYALRPPSSVPVRAVNTQLVGMVRSGSDNR